MGGEPVLEQVANFLEQAVGRDETSQAEVLRAD
jgi:hypothetical protein